MVSQEVSLFKHDAIIDAQPASVIDRYVILC